MKSHKHQTRQKGTKRLVETYGDALHCVRYRNDAIHGIRLKTVEIIVEESVHKSTSHHHDEELVKAIVTYTEKSLRDRLKSAGGRWEPQEKLWLVRYGSIRGTERTGRETKYGLMLNRL